MLLIVARTFGYCLIPSFVAWYVSYYINKRMYSGKLPFSAQVLSWAVAILLATGILALFGQPLSFARAVIVSAVFSIATLTVAFIKFGVSTTRR